MLIKEGVYPATIEHNIVKLKIKNRFYKIVTSQSIRVKGIHNCRYETGGIGQFNWHTVFVGWEPFKIQSIEKVNGVLFSSQILKLLDNKCSFYYFDATSRIVYAKKWYDFFGFDTFNIYEVRDDEHKFTPLSQKFWQDNEVHNFVNYTAQFQLYDMTIENVVNDWSLAHLETVLGVS